jgi:hypothetical protein
MEQDINTAQFGTISEYVNSLLSREGDVAGVRRLQYMEVAKDVFNDLKLTAIKKTKRVLITIDPHLGCINLPSDYFKFSTISAIDRYHRIEPLVYNAEIFDDIVDTGLDRNCESECGCTDAICNYSKGYETISEEVTAIMPDETTQTFTKIIRKHINRDGSVYMEVTEPTAVYDNGTHVSTSLQTTSNFLCKLELKPDCGCVINNKWNREHWREKGSSLAIYGEDDIMAEWGAPNPRYFPESLTYNFSDDGKRIKFPSNFAYRKVLLRYYAMETTKDILVPYLAKKAFIIGIKKELSIFDDKMPVARQLKWQSDYNKAVDVLRQKMNALMLNEFYEYYFGRNATEHLYFHNVYRADYYLPYRLPF